MPKAGFGNLIALPLQGDSIRKGTTLFLDPTTMCIGILDFQQRRAWDSNPRNLR